MLFIIPILDEEIMEFQAVNEVLMINEHVDVYTDTNDSSAIIVSYEAGDVIFVDGISSNGWYRVLYRGQQGYIHEVAGVSVLGDDVAMDLPEGVEIEGYSIDGVFDENIYQGEFGDEAYLNQTDENIETNGNNVSSFGIDVETLDEEFERTTKDVNNQVENIQAQQAYRRSNFFWTAGILLLILAIVVVTIIERRVKRGNDSIDENESDVHKDSKSSYREWDDNILLISEDELPDAIEGDNNPNKELNDEIILNTEIVSSEETSLEE